MNFQKGGTQTPEEKGIGKLSVKTSKSWTKWVPRKINVPDLGYLEKEENFGKSLMMASREKCLF